MPEGDTLLRIAHAVAPAITGKNVDGVRSPIAQVAAAPIAGRRVASVEARGKNLLVHFEGGRALHVHLGMTGSVHLYRAGERWKRPAWRARVALDTEGVVLVVFDAPLVRVVRAPVRDDALARLGPDVLADDFDAVEAGRRVHTLADVPIGDALMDQRAMAGVGNVYKCEALFVCRVNPFARVGALDDTTLVALARACHEMMAANIGPAPRRTTPGRSAARFWVYGRAGRPCAVCGTSIAARRAGARARVTWYCPRCQARESTGTS
jgi:endonuclease-8